MTNIEKKIYTLLASDDDVWTLEDLSGLYTQAHNASFNTYRRIQWDLLDAHIAAKRGQDGLDHCRREAVRVQ